MEIAHLSWNEVTSRRFNHPLLPRSIRGIIVGKSGRGKMTLLLTLLLRPGWLDYDNLCVFGKSFFSTRISNTFETASDIPDPRELDSEEKNLMIFDDLHLEKQNKCECYYIRGRHSNVDCFYLSQNYFKLPRQTIRENANVICLFPQNLKNINHIYNNHVGEDMSKEEFRKFCCKCWEKPHGFTVIDLTGKKDAG